MVFFAEVVLQVVPRRNHVIEAGAQAISRDRLAVHASELTSAAEEDRSARPDVRNRRVSSPL